MSKLIYIKMYREIMQDNKLNRNEQIILCLLIGIAEKGNEIYATNKYIADEINASSKTVKRSLKTLRDKKYIKSKNNTRNRLIEILKYPKNYHENNQSRKSNENNQSRKSNENNQSRKSNENNQSRKSNENNQSRKSNENNQSRKSNENNQSRKSNENNQSRKSNENNQSRKSNEIITIDYVKQVFNENKLSADYKKFFFHYDARAWKFNNGNVITKKSIKSLANKWQIYAKEYNQMKKENNNNSSQIKRDQPEWLQEYIDEINDM